MASRGGYEPCRRLFLAGSRLKLKGLPNSAVAAAIAVPTSPGVTSEIGLVAGREGPRARRVEDSALELERLGQNLRAPCAARLTVIMELQTSLLPSPLPRTPPRAMITASMVRFASRNSVRVCFHPSLRRLRCCVFCITTCIRCSFSIVPRHAVTVQRGQSGVLWSVRQRGHCQSSPSIWGPPSLPLNSWPSQC